MYKSDITIQKNDDQESEVGSSRRQTHYNSRNNLEETQEDEATKSMTV